MIRNAGGATRRPRASPERLNFTDLLEVGPERTASRLLIQVSDLPLQPRVRSCMARLGVVHVGDLVQVSPEALLSQGNFGRGSLRALAATLARIGFGLGQGVEGWPPADLPALLERRRVSINDEVQRILIPRRGGRLEDELRQLSAPAGSPRNMAIVARCLGWDGRGGVTMEEAGREFQLSRQRVSQIVKRMRRQYQHARILPPHLERCLRAATPRLAEDAVAVEDRLYQTGETRSRFRLEGLLTAAETLHLPSPFEILHIESARIVVRPGSGGFLHTGKEDSA